MSGPGLLYIRDLKPGLQNVNVEFMILEPTGMNRTKDGDQVWEFKVADSTAAINFAVMGDSGHFLKPGDICKVMNGFCSVFKGALTFYVGKCGTFKRTGEFCFLISEEINMSIRKPPQPPNTDKSAPGPGSSRRSSADPAATPGHKGHPSAGALSSKSPSPVTSGPVGEPRHLSASNKKSE